MFLEVGNNMSELESTYVIISPKDEAEKTVLIFNFPPLLIPNELYDPSLQRDYLKFQYKIDEIGHIFESEVEDYTALYFLNQQDYFNLTRQYAQIYFFHRSLYYRRVMQQHNTKPPTAENVVVLLLDTNKVDFWIEKQGQLLLMNTFLFTSEHDVLYYVTNILKQYDLLDEGYSLIAKDITNKNGSIVKLLKHYFHLIPFPERELTF